MTVNRFDQTNKIFQFNNNVTSLLYKNDGPPDK